MIYFIRSHSLVWSTSCSSFSSFVQYFRMRNERPAKESTPERILHERQWTMNYDVGWRTCTGIYIFRPSRITNTNKRTNVLLWQTTYYIPKISENKDHKCSILAPLHTALTLLVYWSNEWNELNQVERVRTVLEWNTSFSKHEVLHSFTRVK